MEPTEIMKDNFERKIDYMRISITDRCNLRCAYCMPRGICLVPVEEILTFEEIEMVCQAAAELGIRKFKITGGEPLVRRGCPKLVGRLRALPGVEQVTLTTNGVLLGKYLYELLDNGLEAVNVSLDTLDTGTYRRVTGSSELHTVLDNIDRGVKAGLRVKINSVLQKGINDSEWEALVCLAKERKIDVRFIEMMPIGYGKGCEAVKGEEIFFALQNKYPLIERDIAVHGNGPAAYYRIPGFAGSVGFISAVHGKFCDSCNRIRMTAQGELKPCLCYGDSVDVKAVLRSGSPEGERMDRIKEALKEAVGRKPQMHCFENMKQISEERQMVQIGG